MCILEIVHSQRNEKLPLFPLGCSEYVDEDNGMVAFDEDAWFEQQAEQMRQQNLRVAATLIGAHEEPGGPEQRADKRPYTMFDPCPELAAYGGASKCQRRPPQGPERSPRAAHREQSALGAETSGLSVQSDLTLSRGGSAMRWTALFVAGRGLAGPESTGTLSQKYLKFGTCKSTRTLTPLFAVTRDESVVTRRHVPPP